MASTHAEHGSRPSFALTGRSTALDPRIHAVRGDLADIRLAEQVFAPHYVRAVPKRVARAAALRGGRGADAPVLAELADGEPFELLDVTGGIAWGIAPTHDRVGYVVADALGEAA
jgi:hypothetical protein